MGSYSSSSSHSSRSAYSSRSSPSSHFPSNVYNSNISLDIDKDEYIQSVRKIVVPYKGRNAIIAAWVLASIVTLGLINISEDLRQNLEHHGLIFVTNDFYYVIQYNDAGIKTIKSKDYKECKKEIYNCAPNPYDDETIWTYECSFRNNLTIRDVESKVQSLIPYFNENNYNSLINNCQYFVKDLLEKIS